MFMFVGGVSKQTPFYSSRMKGVTGFSISWGSTTLKVAPMLKRVIWGRPATDFYLLLRNDHWE
jgi:hypothetical protein